MTAIILVGPQMGENIGAAARVMHNFGLDDLRIVAPRDGWPNPKAEEMAAGAKHLIAQATLFDILEDAVSDIQYIAATTVRPRDMVKPAIDVGTLAETLPAGKSAILFGNERSGLSNTDITLANSIVHIPVNPDYSSLNLAQAVAIVCYNLGSHTHTLPDNDAISSAPRQEVIAMLEHLETALEEKGFYDNIEPKRKRMVENLSNIFTRTQLTSQEVQSLRGIIKALSRKG